MSDVWPREAWKESIYGSTLPSWARHVAMVFADYARDRDIVWCGYLTMVKRTALGRSTVIRGVKMLVSDGWLAIVEEGTPARSARYRLTTPGMSSVDTPMSSVDTPMSSVDTPSALPGHTGMSSVELPVSSVDTDLIPTESETQSTKAGGELMTVRRKADEQHDELLYRFDRAHPGQAKEYLDAATKAEERRIGEQISRPGAYFRNRSDEWISKVKLPVAAEPKCKRCEGSNWLVDPDTDESRKCDHTASAA